MISFDIDEKTGNFSSISHDFFYCSLVIFAPDQELLKNDTMKTSGQAMVIYTVESDYRNPGPSV